MDKRARRTYAYRLLVTYPPTSHWEAEGEWDTSWKPEGWTHPDEGEWNGNPDADFSFRWPVIKTYFTRKNAEKRAELLRSFGATVTVEQSWAVVWPSEFNPAYEEACKSLGVESNG